jgi:HSP20 family protein
MAVIRWQPWQEMETLRRQFDRLFDELAPVNPEAAASTAKAWTPAIELKTTDTDVVVRVELPGIEAKDLDIQVAREAIAITGEHRMTAKTEERQFIRTEFRYGNFQRIVQLPVAVQNDQVNAEFKDGILTLTLPKQEAERNKVVKVNLAGTAVPTLNATDAAETESAKTEAA